MTSMKRRRLLAGIGAAAVATAGPVEFVDTRNNKRTGKVQIRPTNTVTAGIPFGRPYTSPFSLR